jgi:YD repeat-containing protein
LLLRDEDPAAGVRTLVRTDLPSRRGHTVTFHSPEGRVTSYTVEQGPGGELTWTRIAPDGTQTVASQRPDGTTTTVQPDGTHVDARLAPDPRWGMQAPITANETVRLPSGLTRTTTFSRTVTLATPGDPRRVSALADTLTVNGRAFKTTYTGSTRTFTSTSPTGRQMTITLNGQGHVATDQVAGVLPITYSYDGRGRLVTATQGSGAEARTVTLDYRSDGYLGKVTEPLGGQTTLEYDPAGRLVGTVLPAPAWWDLLRTPLGT